MGAVGAPPKPKPIPGWKHLSRLLPYVASCKGKVVVGLVTLAGMGLVGVLLPLAFGVIVDSLEGNARAARPALAAARLAWCTY